MLALVAAVLTAGLVWLQIIKQTDQINLMKQQLIDERSRVEQEREGKLRAARGSLPGTLNEVCEYATDLANAFQGGHFRVALFKKVNIDPDEESVVDGPLPKFPTDAIVPLREVLEYATEASVCARIEELFRQAQIVEARARPFGSGKPIKRTERLDLILDAATLYEITASLFPFSRGESAEAPPHGGAFQGIQHMGIQNQEAINLAAQRMVVGQQ